MFSMILFCSAISVSVTVPSHLTFAPSAAAADGAAWLEPYRIPADDGLIALTLAVFLFCIFMLFVPWQVRAGRRDGAARRSALEANLAQARAREVELKRQL